MTRVLTMSPFKPKGYCSMRVIVAGVLAANTEPGILIPRLLADALELDENEQRDQIRQESPPPGRPSSMCITTRRSSRSGPSLRVALAREFAGLAQYRRRLADRQMSKALDIVTHVDEKQLSPAELQRHRAVALIITNLHSRMTDAESRLQQLEARNSLGKQPPVIQGEVEPELQS